MSYSSWDIKEYFESFSGKFEFIPSSRNGHLVCILYLKEQIFSIYISTKNLDKFENSNNRKCFKMVFEFEGMDFPINQDVSIQIALLDEITDYEWENDCNTFEQIKTKIGVEKFSFRKPYHPKVAENYLFDSTIINSNFHKILISKGTYKFINENPKVNTLRLIISKHDNHDYRNMKKKEATYLIEILLWDEMSIEERDYEEEEKQIQAEWAQEDERRFNAMLNEINGDWGGLTGEEAELGRQNCD